MKSKNIPDDIRSKSTKEAQIEIKETSAYKSLVIYENKNFDNLQLIGQCKKIEEGFIYRDPRNNKMGKKN